MIKAAIKNLQKFKRDIKAFDKRQKKAYIDAVKIEAYRLRTQLRNEYQKGMGHWPTMREVSKINRAYQIAYGKAATTYPGSGISIPDEDAPPHMVLPCPYDIK